MMSVAVEIEILELAADLIASDPERAFVAISDATDRLLPPPNYRYADYVLDRFGRELKEQRPDEEGFVDRKLALILDRIRHLKNSLDQR